MKKLLSIFLCFILLLSFGTVIANAETSLDISEMQELYLSTTAGQNGYYQWNPQTGNATFVPPEDIEDFSQITGTPDTIEEEPSVTPYSIIGSDNRVKVSNPTGQYASTCLLGMRFGPNNDDVYVGTGWLLNNSYVATAGHNLYDSHYKNNGNDGFALHIAVYIGASGGTYKQYRLGHWHSVGGDYYKNPDGSNYDSIGSFDDWGTIKLDSPVTANVGALGRYPVSNASDMIGRTYYSQGYPGDLNSNCDRWDNFYMYATSGKILGNRTRTLACVYTDLDATEGQSGSAIYSYRDGYGYTAEAIHIGNERGGNNVAVLITPWLRNHFNSLS